MSKRKATADSPRSATRYCGDMTIRLKYIPKEGSYPFSIEHDGTVFTDEVGEFVRNVPLTASEMPRAFDKAAEAAIKYANRAGEFRAGDIAWRGKRLGTIDIRRG